MVHFPRKGVVADPNSNFFRNKEQGYKGGGSRWFSKNPKFSCFFSSRGFPKSLKR